MFILLLCLIGAAYLAVAALGLGYAGLKAFGVVKASQTSLPAALHRSVG